MALGRVIRIMLNKYLIIVLFCFLRRSHADAGERLVVGGYNITIDQAPHQISLLYNDKHHCGGSIYNNVTIITAAHCLAGRPLSNFKIRAGSTFTTEGGVVIAINSSVSHNDYVSVTGGNDVAILRLAEALTFSDNIKAVELIEDGATIPDGAEVSVTGWGYLQEGGPVAVHLQRAEVPIVNHDTCNTSYYKDQITSTMICAGYSQGGTDTCSGDSGGPLIYQGKLAGITSWGDGCARANKPGIYAKVTAIRSWILNNISPSAAS